MIDSKDLNALRNFKHHVLTELNNNIDSYLNQSDLSKAANLIICAENNNKRLHITGVGKPAHIASYAASLFSSTGSPAYFLDATEAVHGSCGQLIEGDIVICISNSGQTLELISTINAIKNNNCKVIAITGNSNSKLAELSDVVLYAQIENEGGPLNRAPRCSILAEILVIQGLSVMLQSYKNISPHQYVKWHPGGTLGKLRKDESD